MASCFNCSQLLVCVCVRFFTVDAFVRRPPATVCFVSSSVSRPCAERVSWRCVISLHLTTVMLKRAFCVDLLCTLSAVVLACTRVFSNGDLHGGGEKLHPSLLWPESFIPICTHLRAVSVSLSPPQNWSSIPPVMQQFLFIPLVLT